jgi:hypothetical protein
VGSELSAGLAQTARKEVIVMKLNLAEVCESRKTDNMAEVERQGGVWKDGSFRFPDGSCGSFSDAEPYRDSKGLLRSHPIFLSESARG